MIENITEEKLDKIINEIVIPNSNIGVHKMTGPYADDYEQTKEVYDKILKEGFKTKGGEKSHHGIISHIAMCGSSNDNISNNILNWNFGSRTGEGIKIIFAIPSIIECNDKKYYIGEYPYSVAKNKEAESIPYGKFVEKIPKEFIMGYLKIKQGTSTVSHDFIVNKDYIGLKSSEEIQSFFDSYEKVLENKFILTFDERGYNLANMIKKEPLDGIFGDTYYIKKFLDKYNELNKSGRIL